MGREIQFQNFSSTPGPATAKSSSNAAGHSSPQLGDESNIKVIGKVSHDQLFRHASAVIHHGGAVTTASALYAGKPQIVVPHIGDQTFFGMEVERLGCGFRIGKKNWPEQLADALARLASDPAHAAKAAAVRAQLLTENGPPRAIEELEKFVVESRTTEAGVSR